MLKMRSVLSKDKFTRSSIKWLVVLLHGVNFWAYLGQFNSVLVHLPFSLYNPFQDTSKSNANQTNSLKAKRCLFAPDALISQKFITLHERWRYFLLVFVIQGSCIMSSSLFVCREPSDEALFGYHGTQPVRIFKLMFNYCHSAWVTALFGYHGTQPVRTFKLIFNYCHTGWVTALFGYHGTQPVRTFKLIFNYCHTGWVTVPNDITNPCTNTGNIAIIKVGRQGKLKHNSLVKHSSLIPENKLSSNDFSFTKGCAVY